MPDDFEQRLTAVETRLGEEGRLRASVDEDLSRLEEQQKRTLEQIKDLRIAQANHFGMLMDRQTENLNRFLLATDDLGRKFASLDAKVNLHEQRFSALEAKVDALDAKVDALEAKVDALDAKVDALEAKVDAIDAKVDALEAKVDALEAKVDRVLRLLEQRPG